MNLPPLVRKVDHIEGLRFHPEDTQNALFDVIVNGMELFQGVDESGEKCEYMYLHSKDGNMYKVLVPSLPPIAFQNFLFANVPDEVSLSKIVILLKTILYNHIDMIPTKMVGNITQDFLERHPGKPFSSYTAFKCLRSRIVSIKNNISMIESHYNIPLDITIKKEIEEFQVYIMTRYNSGAWRKGVIPGGRYDDTKLGVTKEDIQQGNEILEKVIAYLEDKLEKESSV